MPKYVSGVRREDFIERTDYLRALHESGEPIPDEALSSMGGGFYGDLLRSIHPDNDAEELPV
jgi:hypothetical protein